MTAARSILEGGGLTGFDYLGRHRLKHLGVAFATKYLYFCSAAMKATQPAPILDRIVSNWFADNAGGLIRLGWDSGNYHAYCGALTRWADQLGRGSGGRRVLDLRPRSR